MQTNNQSSRLRQLALFALIAGGAFAAPAPSAWSVDYARWPDGHVYGKAEAAQDWPAVPWFNQPGASRVCEFPAGSRHHWLEVNFAHDTFGGGTQGCMFSAELAPRSSYTVEYEVRFPAGWEFSRNNEPPHGGGKLPGLSGGSHPSGGHGKPDGMSARPMWRRDARFSAQPQNYLELYLYWRNQSEKYGDRIFAQQVEAERTYRIKLQVELGTSERDGFVRVWIDGVPRIDRPYRFLGRGQDWKLSHYMHEVFYGGNDATWAPARDQHLLLGPVRVDTHPF